MSINPEIVIPTHEDETNESFNNEDSDKQLPTQPLEIDKEGVIRFRPNRIVETLLDAARDGNKIDLNMIASMFHRNLFTQAEMEQFMQLIGYSFDGWSDLSFVSEYTRQRASKQAEPMRGKLER